MNYLMNYPSWLIIPAVIFGGYFALKVIFNIFMFFFGPYSEVGAAIAHELKSPGWKLCNVYVSTNRRCTVTCCFPPTLDFSLLEKDVTSILWYRDSFHLFFLVCGLFRKLNKRNSDYVNGALEGKKRDAQVAFEQYKNRNPWND